MGLTSTLHSLWKRKQSHMEMLECTTETSMPLCSPPLKPTTQITEPEFSSLLHNQQQQSLSKCPSLLQKMQNSTCYKCGGEGHWRYCCPLNRMPSSPFNSPASAAACTTISPIATFSSSNNSSASIPATVPDILCRCGHGKCEVKAKKANGRRYYICPITRGLKCGFFKWCDQMTSKEYNEFKFQSALKYPECGCGAGVCRKIRNAGRTCFVCPIKRSHGACSYILCEDDLRNMSSNNSLGLEDNIGLKHLVEPFSGTNTQSSPAMAVAVTQEAEGVGYKTKPVDAQEYDEILSTINISEFIDPFELQVRNDLQHEVKKDITSFGATTESVTVSRSTGAIHTVIAKEKNLSDNEVLTNLPNGVSNSKCQTTLALDANEYVQPATHTKSLGICSEKGSSKLLGSKSLEGAILLQNQLIANLEKLKPHDYDRMRKMSNSIFDALKLLEVDCQSFSKHVFEFIDCSCSLLKTEESIQQCLALDELNKLWEREKMTFNNVCNDHATKEALLKECSLRIKVLGEKETCMKELLSEFEKQSICGEEENENQGTHFVLHEIENQLTDCKAQSIGLGDELAELRIAMVESDKKLQIYLKKIDDVRKLHDERKAIEMAAKTSLEKARIPLHV